MKLYFLRHAEALDGADDAARPLSALGKEQSRTMAKFLKQAGIEFDAAFSSPLVRAVQTAEIVTDVVPTGRKLKRVDALLNETSQKDFSGWLHQLDVKSVLLVGHEPTMASRVRHLLGISSRDALTLPKAGIACVETEDCLEATLKFFVSPKVLGL